MNLSRRLSSVVVGVLLLGAGPALAQTKGPPAFVTAEMQAQAAALEARVAEAARALDKNPKLQKFTHEQRKDLVEFVSGNLLFALVHEVGHALVSEMGLPVLGREEDAADAYAVVSMLRIGTSFTENVLIDVAKGWFLADERAQTEGIKAAFYDEHGMDKQRAYQIVCLMVGSDPDKYGKLATDVGMPEQRQAGCEGDYSNAKWSWDTLLKPHLRALDQPKQKIDTVYGPGKGMFNGMAEAAQIIRLIETVAEFESERYVWRSPFTIEMQTCGVQNAQWDLSAKKITICYEIGADFMSLYVDYVINKDEAANAQVRARRDPCLAGSLDVAAATAIRHYSGGQH